MVKFVDMMSDLELLLKESIVKSSALGGGCIANTRYLLTESGRELVVKKNAMVQIPIKEANGLNELRKSGVIKTPQVIYADEQFLILEFIRAGSRPDSFFSDFGRQLAQLHKYSSAAFGFYEDNYIGSSPQLNRAVGEERSDWPAFYFNKRLLVQYELAEKNGYVDAHFHRLFRHLESVLPELLNGSEEAPSLLHGDLWGGNYMVGSNGEPVLIDPAVYYGHREAELAMTHLFGGFDQRFYEAYNAEWPLKPGYQQREAVYTLYHVLNHLNIFGTSYRSQALALMQQYT
jgi:protein-ribulosamine 3-kinase